MDIVRNEPLSGRTITINAGGQVFTTLKTTLPHAFPGSMFSMMFDDHNESLVYKDSNGHVFLDCDPAYFAYVLRCARVCPIEIFLPPMHVPGCTRLHWEKQLELWMITPQAMGVEVEAESIEQETTHKHYEKERLWKAINDNTESIREFTIRMNRSIPHHSNYIDEPY